MRLVLVLPGLAARNDERARVARLRALARLIAAAGAPLREPEGLGAMLAPHYGIARQSDWPLAPLWLAALDADPGDAYWLAADPVTLVAGRDDVRVGEAVADLSPAEAQGLIATLNRHFAADGLAYLAPRPDAWFVRASSPPRIVTHALDAATGRALRVLLPEGPDAARWRRWLSEIQMLFHEHPVNVARERAGRAGVTSVWFSGGGTLPPRAAHGPRIRTWANGGIATALALHVGISAQALPLNFSTTARSADDDDVHVVVCDPPLDLPTIETAWAAPAWNALAAGRMDAVTLIGDGAGDALAWTTRRPGPWQRILQRFAQHDLDALLDAARSTP